MALGDFFADSQTDAGAFVFAAAMQALEHPKDALEMFGCDADAIIPHRHHPLFAEWGGGDFDDRGAIGAVVLEGIADQVSIGVEN
jgi:hypothetical protein